jgi:hypothetical protein
MQYFYRPTGYLPEQEGSAFSLLAFLLHLSRHKEGNNVFSSFNWANKLMTLPLLQKEIECKCNINYVQPAEARYSRLEQEVKQLYFTTLFSCIIFSLDVWQTYL